MVQQRATRSTASVTARQHASEQPTRRKGDRNGFVGPVAHELAHLVTRIGRQRLTTIAPFACFIGDPTRALPRGVRSILQPLLGAIGCHIELVLRCADSVRRVLRSCADGAVDVWMDSFLLGAFVLADFWIHDGFFRERFACVGCLDSGRLAWEHHAPRIIAGRVRGVRDDCGSTGLRLLGKPVQGNLHVTPLPSRAIEKSISIRLVLSSGCKWFILRYLNTHLLAKQYRWNGVGPCRDYCSATRELKRR